MKTKNSTTEKQKLGEMIKARRVERIMTLNAVARMLMLKTGKVHSVAQIRALEEGTSNYSINLLLNICEELDIVLTATSRPKAENNRPSAIE